MRRDSFLFLTAIVLSGIFFVQNDKPALGSAVINEIGAYEAQGYEWIEIWNSGSEPIEMNDWKFIENNTNHFLAVSSTDSLLEPEEYAVICQDEENFLSAYPSFSGSIFDSSWGSLNESGEEIGLRDNNGDIISLFTYPSASDYSLERLDPFRPAEETDNWREHISGNTLGFINSYYGVTSTAPITTSTTPTTTLPEATSTIDYDLRSSLKINEVVSDPDSGNEWVELYLNSSSSLDLSQAVICDSRETNCKTATGTIEGFSFAIIDLQSSSFLNNDGDSVVLKDIAGTIIDQIDYAPPLAPAKKQSLARLHDGVDTDQISDWSITTSITKGNPNEIVALPIPVVNNRGGGSPEPILEQEIEEVSLYKNISGLLINELYPNPSGSDEIYEFIEIINTSIERIDLTHWIISDSVRKFTLGGEILPGQILYWLRSQTNIALNNSTAEEVKLIAPDEKIIDSIKYSGARENESYARNAEGRWLWTPEITPGKENIFSQSEIGGVIWKIIAPTSGRPNEMLIFDAEDSADERGGLINYYWDFGDGEFALGGEVMHAYSATGSFVATIYATSSAGSFSSKKIKIQIGDELSQTSAEIQINEILPNPADDEMREYVELINTGSFPVDLSGWKLKNKAKKFEFPNGTIIGPAQMLVFFRRVTGFAINNQGDAIELINRDDNLVDLVKIGKAKEGMSYALLENEWQWTGELTPGQTNRQNTPIITATPKQSVKKSGPVYKRLSIAESRAEDAGSSVIVRGWVTAVPGIFGVQYFYLGDSDYGIQVYCYKKDFPELEVGDYVEVTGETSEAQGIKRIKIKDKRSIDILRTGEKIIPAAANLDELNEEDCGRLVEINGVITETRSGYAYLDNTRGEVKVYLKNGTGVDKKIFKIDDYVKLVGVVEVNRNELQIWPRNSNDIYASSSIKAIAGEKIVSSSLNNKYFLFLIVGITALGLGFITRSKGGYISHFIAGRFKKK